MDLFVELGFKSLYKRLPDDSFEEDAEEVFAKQMGMF